MRTYLGTDLGHTGDTNNNDNNNIYLYLFNIYSAKIFGKNFGEKIKLINQCKSEEKYNQLTIEEQDKLFNKLMNIK